MPGCRMDDWSGGCQTARVEHAAYWLVIPRETRLREPIEGVTAMGSGLFDALV